MPQIKINYEALPDELKKLFIADGCENLPGKFRSKWHDYQELRRKGNRRDFISNVWATPIASSDAVFDTTVLEEIKDKYIREPNFEGEVVFEYDIDGYIQKEDIELEIEGPYFILDSGGRRLKWWGNLIKGRPDQRHNYIVGCDPSYGLGSSNSVASIYDVNTKELVGEWVCTNTKPEDFADQSVAIAQWIGGVDDAFLIWENNGGHGVNFTNRVIWQGYYSCYTQTVEDSKTRQRQKKYGFHSTQDRKAAILGELSIALACGISGDKNYKSCLIYSKELLDELFDYIFVGEGKEIATSLKADLSSGARERHGDRAIAVALCILGTRDQFEGDYSETRKVPFGSFEFYRRAEEVKQKEDYRKAKKYLFGTNL